VIVLDEQLKNSGVAEQIAGWYRGRIVNITSLRPGTVIKDDAIPMLLRQIRDSTFVTINTTDFLAPDRSRETLLCDMFPAIGRPSW